MGSLHNLDQVSHGGGSLPLNVSSPERVRDHLKQGWEFLRAGRPCDAGLAFGRILLRDPRHAEAQRGRASANAAADEVRRHHETLLDEARRALEAGEDERSRRLLSQAAGGDERERALVLLDRLDAREGRIAGPPDRMSTHGAGQPAEPVLPPVGLRRVLLAGWAVAIVWLGAGLAGSWDRIVDGLLEAPAPASRETPPGALLPAPQPGERALEQASRLLAQGDAAGAVAVLRGVSPDDPVYPFSLRLRLEAQAALASPRPRR